MPYTITFITENGIIKIKNEGELTYEELITQTRKVAQLQQKKNTHRILTDFVAVIMKVNLADLFQFPDLYEKLGMKRDSRIAVLVSQAETKTDELNFYETICLNRGWNIKIFLEEKKAVTWLLSEE